MNTIDTDTGVKKGRAGRKIKNNKKSPQPKRGAEAILSSKDLPRILTMTERNMKERCLKAVKAINIAKNQCREILKIASNNNEQSSVDYWSRVNSRLVDYHAYLLDVLDASNDVDLITFDLNSILSQVDGLTKEIDRRLTHILHAVNGSDDRRGAIYAYGSKSDMH